MTWREKIWDTNLSLLGIGLAIASTITITNTFKNLVGRPRPGIISVSELLLMIDFLDRCQPLSTATNPTIFTLSTAAICTRTVLLKDGYRSFPSGHSSSTHQLFLSDCSLVFWTWISCFICCWKTKCSRHSRTSLENNHRSCSACNSWLHCSIPLNGQSVSFIQIISKSRHHPFDVIFGSALGMLFAWMAYRQYFPALSLAEGGRPYSIAEFATEKDERPIAYTTASPPDRDLELGQTRNRLSQQNIEGRWDGMDTDIEEDHGRPS